MDASSNFEDYNLRVFFVMTHSVLGALPLGILITSDEQVETLIKGFKQLRQCFDDKSFFGRGGNVGPSFAVTDNCSELQDALSQVWPNMDVFLCLFHILQQVWRYELYLVRRIIRKNLEFIPRLSVFRDAFSQNPFITFF